ncbi:uncharacterized protein LOC142339607 isoform X2 [Convolutriloba macropyga]|uniref:uncharacterized protein LOC142339607 isoform X2 n=1 Tax=Convolutriloba macropyga TaxID=536237 RepID=UPI003F520522
MAGLHVCPKVEPDPLTESDEYEENDTVDDDFSNCSSSLTLKLPEVQVSSNNDSDLISEHIYALPFPKLANPNADTLTFKHHSSTRTTPTSANPVPRISSPEISVSMTVPKPVAGFPSVPPLHRRNTDTILKHPSLHRPIAPRPQVSKYGTNPRLATSNQAEWLTSSPGDWTTRSFGRFKKTESTILPSTSSEHNSNENDYYSPGDYIDVNGRMFYKRGSLMDHQLYCESKNFEKRSSYNNATGGGVYLEPVQLLALHDNGQLRPVSFVSPQEQQYGSIYESTNKNDSDSSGAAANHGFKMTKFDKNRRPVSMINLGTNSSNSGAQKHLQILTQCYEVESSRENIDRTADNLVSNANESFITSTTTTNGNINNNATSINNNQLNLKQTLTSTTQSKTYTNGLTSNGHHQTTKSATNLTLSHSNDQNLPPSNYQRLVINSPKKTSSFMETLSSSESESVASSSTSGKPSGIPNRFEQKYKFDLNSESEISWGDAEMAFGVQVTKEHVVNRNYYYDFRVTASEGANVNYHSLDREFDFITTNFPLVETKFFEEQLRRVYPTIVIPDCPQLSPTPSSGPYCGTLSLEIWLSWLGRHPVIGKSPIFWHMLRYARSKDWHGQKTSIKKVEQFIKQRGASLADGAAENAILTNYPNFLHQEKLQAIAIEHKLLSLLNTVELSLKQHSMLIKAEKYVIKSIGEEMRNFSEISKLRNPDNTSCSDSFSFVGHKIATCEDKLHTDWLESSFKLRVQLQTILSAYRRLIKILNSRSLKKYVKLFQTLNKQPKQGSKKVLESNAALLTCYTFLAELNYLKSYEIDLVFTPTYQFVKEVQTSFEEASEDLANAFDTIKF